MNQTEVYLVDGCRSPIGRGHPEKGIFKHLRADQLTSQLLLALLERTGLDPTLVDDFYLGCVGQHLEQGKNLARLVWLLSGLPEAVPGATINRLCGSSLTALQMAADSIRAGTNQIMIVGGVEHLGHVPMQACTHYNPLLFEESEFQWTNMGLTAEKLADQFKIGREEQDRYALQSNERYFAALESGFYHREIVPIMLPDGTVVKKDQEPRLSSLEKLAQLKTPFKENGTVTAANASGVSDGAGVALVCSHEQLRASSTEPLARIIATSNVGLDPTVMGLGPVYAVRKLLEKTSLTADQIDFWEINEAFAVQVLACKRELKIPDDRLNVHGGAVALGHPLGMSGIRLAITLARTLADRDARYGVATMCVGHGQGVAMLLERA